MDGGAWWAAVHGVSMSRARLSDFTVTFHFHTLEKEMATHSSVLAWRIPGTGEPGGLPSMGPHRVGQDWSELAAAASVGNIVTSNLLLNLLRLSFPNCKDKIASMTQGYVGVHDVVVSLLIYLYTPNTKKMQFSFFFFLHLLSVSGHYVLLEWFSRNLDQY